MGRRARRPSDGPEVVARYIETCHPNCPPELKAFYHEQICNRIWTGKMTVGQAFGIVASNHVRHSLTDYETLLRVHKLTRDEARLVVAQEVTDIMQSWAPIKAGNKA